MTEMRSHPSTGSKHVENKVSTMITKDENELVFRLLGNRCQTLATTVVQLYLSEAPDHRSWRKRECGVLCLVKDNQRRSYYFRLFCPLRRTLIWEHEVYVNMEYKAPLPYLHTFEAEECMAAFNFANESEAAMMRNALMEKLQNRKQKRIDRRSRPPSQPPAQLQRRDPGTIQPPGPPLPNGLPESPSLSRGKDKSKNRRDKDNRKKITKADIGLPLDFRHVSHVGWDPNRGFDVDNVEDPQLKHFFAMAGVSDSQLQDRETREFIYDFINRHGGIDAVKEDLHATPSPPSGPSPLSAPSLPQLQGPPPPVPARFVNAPSARTAAPPPPPQQPPPPVRTGPLPPPPPPPIRTIPRADASQPPPANRAVGGSSPAVAPPPPPPPPPPPLEPPAPPPPPPGPLGPDTSAPSSGGSTAPPLPPVSDAHSTLMDAIKTGKTLKHVEVDRRPSADSRGELLDQIRQGVELRSVSTAPRNDRPVSSVTAADSLAGALARALAERSRAIHSSSDSSSDGGEDGEDGDDDEEWED